MIADLNVGIVGGSITGCCAAILLERAGHRVTVFERSNRGLVGRGGGIGTIGSVLRSMIEDDLLDADFPHTSFTKLAFTAGSPRSDRMGVSPWQAPMDFHAFHWTALWNQLRKRVPDTSYRDGHEVTAVIANGPNGAALRLADGSEHTFDLVLFADGYQSLGRATLFPGSELSYRGYLLWRGLLRESELEHCEPLEDSVVRLSFSSMPGDLVMHFIPNENGSTKRGDRICNWDAYVQLPDNLSDFMVDHLGGHQPGAIPPRRMSAESESELKELVAANLPAYFATIIRETQNTYVQLVYNNELSRYAKDRVCVVGDAGIVVQPFTMSGVFKGLNNVQDLLKALRVGDTLQEALERWSSEQVRVGRRLLALAAQLEDALIWNRLDFTKVDAKTTEAWWRAAVKWPEEFSPR
jgi:2-polyprenyl-6-methoxyphenol hydroxylase-like FAD-dependent oxidoreductase